MRILLGITGGIAAYKTPDLVRRLLEDGHEIQIVMSSAAEHFVAPLALQAVSGNLVRRELFDERAEQGMGHIELARWAEIILIAPATADMLARLAVGRADDLLSTLCLATTAPVGLVPAMNTVMWEHPATQQNCATLRERNVVVLEPEVGAQACGEFGPGRMPEAASIREWLTTTLVQTSAALVGLKVMLTAGPTHEDIDPVRFLGNRSSGKMGYALAQAAQRAGAEVTLITGPSSLPLPHGVRTQRVRSAREMRDAVLERVEGCDVFISAAAVADYRPRAAAPQKIKKSEDSLELVLERNPDILSEVASHRYGPFCVGFAAETEDLESNARKKLHHKRLQMIVANQVGRDECGFDADCNEVLVLWDGGSQAFPRMSKTRTAAALIELIAARFRDRSVSAA